MWELSPCSVIFIDCRPNIDGSGRLLTKFQRAGTLGYNTANNVTNFCLYVVWLYSRMQVFQSLVQIGRATAVQDFDRLVEQFMASPEYKSNVLLQRYFQTTWLTCAPIWAACYRQVTGLLM